ncbi:hypothetical protein ACFSCX_17485 [Bacillus salitolerans]|uniref:Uncharacterized protein n=1 Tax=Bacillus salitolerans TaxID=1437434 RepID=A0ABW4LT32_9BACI
MKLDATVTVELAERDAQSDGEFAIALILNREEGDSIVVYREIDQSDATPGPQVVLPLTWVDLPGAGTQNYSIDVEIITSSFELATIKERAITATIYPPGSVLPSFIG